MSKYFYTFIFICSFFMVQAQAWELASSPPFLRHHTNGFGYENVAYVVAGGTSNSLSDEFYMYDSELDTWSQLEDFPGVARGFAIGDEYEGIYYYGFGATNFEYLKDVWTFDPETQEWEELPQCPCVGRYHPAMVAYKGKLYIGSGSTAAGNSRDFWVLDLQTLEWEQKEDIPGAKRHHPFQFAIGDYFYVGGGHVGSWHRFHIEEETWEPIDNAPLGRVAGAQIDFAGKGILLGGDKADHEHIPADETFMIYHPEEDEWEKLLPMPGGSRWATSTFIINNEIYFLNGVNYTAPNDNTMWKLNLEDYEQFNLGDPTAINSVQIKELKVHPSPASNEIYLSTSSNEDLRTFDGQIFNTQGEVVLRFQNQYQSPIDISELPSGIYLIKANNSNETYQSKFIKI